jgi:hypothetical protein
MTSGADTCPETGMAERELRPYGCDTLGDGASAAEGVYRKMALPIQHARSYEGSAQIVVLVDPPDVCPVCSRAVEPKYIASYMVLVEGTSRLEVVFACARRACQRLFSAVYGGKPNISLANTSGYWQQVGIFPITRQEHPFEQQIADLSPRFCKIYNQAHVAEQDGLDLICGPGFRKALEFLMKDYAKSVNGARAEEIEEMRLGPCIREFVGDQRIKAMAERATWLGTDETHYMRQWEGKDISDLKKLIDLTVGGVPTVVGS